MSWNGERLATLSTTDDESTPHCRQGQRHVGLFRVEGCDLYGIHYSRVRHLRPAAPTRNPQAAVLIGGSYIGCEVAASLTAAHGVDCTIVMMEDVTFENFFGDKVGGFFQGVLEEHGVTVHGGQELERFEGDGERVTKVVTKAGLELDCDFVVGDRRVRT